MNRSAILTSLFCLASLNGTASQSILAEEPRVQFDLPGVAVAYHQVEIPSSQQTPVSIPTGWNLVNFELRLSCINTSTANLPMQQCIVRVKPRNSSLQIVDYSPRTELMSELTTPIQVKRSDERTSSMGLSLDGSYGHAAKGNIGTNQGNKKSESVQYDRAAPVQAVIASGTFDRGRGAYFKLRWTDTQVLEGERRFRLTMSVPPTWRGELVDVSVVGEVEHRSFTSWDSELKPVASANFIVATYMDHDAEAAALAYKLAEIEYQLRAGAMTTRTRSTPKTLPEMLRHVAMKIEIDTPPVDTTWLTRLLLAQTDPHVDNTIGRLPTDLRVIALDYVDLRRDFLSLRGRSGAEAIAKMSDLP